MSYSNGIISAPVTIDDVKEALGESSNDLATLCKSKNINIWSKYKPVNLTKTFVSDTINSDKSSWNAVGNRGWWLGDAGLGNGVYKINILNGFDNIDFLGLWMYNRPTGGSSSPYRLSDFVGYNSDDYGEEYNPIRVSSLPDTIYIDDYRSIGFLWGDEPYSPNLNINVNDVVGLVEDYFNSLYPAICIYNKTKRQMQFVSAEESHKISQKDVSYGDYFYEFWLDFKNRTIGKEDDTIAMSIPINKGDEIWSVGLLVNVPDINEDYFYSAVSVCPLFDSENDYSAPSILHKSIISEKSKPSYPRKVTVSVSDFEVNRYGYGSTRYVRDEYNGIAIPVSEYIDFKLKLKSDTTLNNAKIKLTINGTFSYDDNYSSVDDVNVAVSDEINLASMGSMKVYTVSNDDNFSSKFYMSKADAENDDNYAYTVQIPICTDRYYNSIKKMRWNIILSIEADMVDIGSGYYYNTYTFVGDYVGNNSINIYSIERSFN